MSQSRNVLDDLTADEFRLHLEQAATHMAEWLLEAGYDIDTHRMLLIGQCLTITGDDGSWQTSPRLPNAGLSPASLEAVASAAAPIAIDVWCMAQGRDTLDQRALPQEAELTRSERRTKERLLRKQGKHAEADRLRAPKPGPQMPTLRGVDQLTCREALDQGLVDNALAEGTITPEQAAKIREQAARGG